MAADLPPTAAWRHVGARDGFEVLFLDREGEDVRCAGRVTAIEAGQPWTVDYTIVLDQSWTTRAAHVLGRSVAGVAEVRIEGDGTGDWRVEGRPAPHLARCLDVDLEASAFTNAFPVRRLALGVGRRADAPAVYVRAPDLRVERLEQRYARLPDEGPRARYGYAAPDLDFAAELAYDEFGLVVDYPGLAIRMI